MHPYCSDNLIIIARSLIGKGHFKRSATLEQAPHEFNCITFVWWLYVQMGIVLPPRLEMMHRGTPIPIEEIRAGDLIFMAGIRSYYSHPHFGDIGHVGIATGDNTLIHATSRWLSGIQESPLDIVTRQWLDFRAACRIMTTPYLAAHH